MVIKMGKRKGVNIRVFLDGEVYIEGNRIEEHDEKLIIEIVNDYLITINENFRIGN